jgi:hypothetical protein
LAIWRIRKEYQELGGNRPCDAKSLNFKAFFLEMAKVELSGASGKSVETFGAQAY